MDITGQKFGKLTAIRFDHKSNKGYTYWKFKCDCGKTHIAAKNNVKSGSIRSCGCLARELAYKHKIVHGHTKNSGKLMSPTYISWICMKSRCFNKKHVAYHKYGAKGITVDERWLKFENFLADMGERPKGKTLDRIDNLVGYCKENCRWATNKEQSRNRSGVVKVKFYGREYALGDLSDKLMIPSQRLYSRIKNKWTQREIEEGKHRVKIGHEVPNEKNLKELKLKIMQKFKKSAELVKLYFGVLDDREKYVIEQRLGLIDSKRKTLAEIGKKMGNISRERVRQLEIKGLKKIDKIDKDLTNSN